MKFEKINVTKCGGWVRLQGDDSPFMHFYTNEQNKRTPSKELEAAVAVILAAPELLATLDRCASMLATLRAEGVLKHPNEAALIDSALALVARVKS